MQFPCFVRLAFLAATFTVLTATQARAQAVVQQTNVQTQDEGPSIFTSGYQGMFAGAAAGGGAGYIVGRKDGWESSDWQAVGLGLGIGALAGAGLGVTLGIADCAGAPRAATSRATCCLARALAP